MGVRKLAVLLEPDYGICAGVKLIVRARRGMGLRTIFCHPTTSRPFRRQDGGMPHLLKENPSAAVDDAWCSDISCLQIGRCNLCLCCEMNWVSREVSGWSQDCASEQLRKASIPK